MSVGRRLHADRSYKRAGRLPSWLGGGDSSVSVGRRLHADRSYNWLVVCLAGLGAGIAQCPLAVGYTLIVPITGWSFA